MPLKQRIAIFGGTFDPIHLGHVELAVHAKNAAELDQVIFLPCLQSPHKKEAPLAAPDQRVKMIRKAIAEFEWISVSRWELDRPPPSYSWLAAEHFSGNSPDTELFWMLGDDQWDQIHTWSKPARIAEILTFIVFPRYNSPRPKHGYRSLFIDLHHNASSTKARELLAKGNPTQDLLDPRVAEYIARNGIYS